jgi:hypothetical protein
MKRRKMKWPKGKKPKLHHGGVLNDQHAVIGLTKPHLKGK